MSNNALASLPIFHGMSDAERDELLSLAQRVEIRKGEQIITQGKMLRNLWFILEGEAQVTRRTDSGCQITLAELGPSVQFGEMSFFHAAPHSADVVAMTDMKLLKLSREDFDRLCEAGNRVAHRLAMNSLQQMAERLRKTDEWITNLVCGEDHKPSASEWTSFREILFRGN